MLFSFNWQVPNLPGRRQPSTLSGGSLHFCVRHGYRCCPSPILTRFPILRSHPHLLHRVPTIMKLSTLSTASLHISRCFHLQPICLLFLKSSQIPHLKAGFTLRCFQRLSAPDLVTRLYRWRDNRFPIGLSCPVLSY